MREVDHVMSFDYQIDLVSDIKLVAESMQHDLTDDQIDTIASKVFSNYSFNEWIEELIEDIK
tara:strand:- start:203 stop:388 length:186 start_codon:yes stop_codon:yes gene_type:complete